MCRMGGHTRGAAPRSHSQVITFWCHLWHVRTATLAQSIFPAHHHMRSSRLLVFKFYPEFPGVPELQYNTANLFGFPAIGHHTTLHCVGHTVVASALMVDGRFTICQDSYTTRYNCGVYGGRGRKCDGKNLGLPDCRRSKLTSPRTKFQGEQREKGLRLILILILSHT